MRNQSDFHIDAQHFSKETLYYKCPISQNHTARHHTVHRQKQIPDLLKVRGRELPVSPRSEISMQFYLHVQTCIDIYSCHRNQPQPTQILLQGCQRFQDLLQTKPSKDLNPYLPSTLSATVIKLNQKNVMHLPCCSPQTYKIKHLSTYDSCCGDQAHCHASISYIIIFPY